MEEKKKFGKIEVIGTSHVAKESIDQLKEKITREKPDIVTVELDPIRFQDLMSNQTKVKKIRIRDIYKIGLFGWMFAVVGAFVQRRLGQQVGARPGSDMKSAILAARDAKSQVVLIDRNIGETVQRLSNSVPLKEKLYLLWFILFGWLFEKEEMERLNKLDLRKVPSDKVIHKIIYDFRHKFPNIYKVLVSERDHYMAARIKLLHFRFPEADILVVVGAGHVKGINKLLKTKTK